ncbi:helix-turn-helix domain-containing protein [Pedobacter rhodius]|uniref:helix-turn-helix domain-containing protein n=1 Tax=Pedobacter rhodius TaxID=3004098 RepID=UPI003D182763
MLLKKVAEYNTFYRFCTTYTRRKTISLREAKLLLTTCISVKEIIINFGFLDIPHFSRYFKSQTSATSTEYRGYLIIT